MILKVDDNGSPILDDVGKPIQIDDIAELKQRLIDIFRNQIGSDLLLPRYGFDLLTANELHGNENSVAYMIKPLVADALDPDLIIGVNSIDRIEVKVESGIVDVEIQLTRSNGESVTEDLRILRSD